MSEAVQKFYDRVYYTSKKGHIGLYFVVAEQHYPETVYNGVTIPETTKLWLARSKDEVKQVEEFIALHGSFRKAYSEYKKSGWKACTGFVKQPCEVRYQTFAERQTITEKRKAEAATVQTTRQAAPQISESDMAEYREFLAFKAMKAQAAK